MTKLYFHSHFSGLVPVKVLRKLPEKVSLPIKGERGARATVETNGMYEVEVIEKCGAYPVGHIEWVYARDLIVDPKYNRFGVLSSAIQADVDKYPP